MTEMGQEPVRTEPPEPFAELSTRSWRTSSAGQHARPAGGVPWNRRHAPE
jgi:hypothetical protein